MSDNEASNQLEQKQRRPRNARPPGPSSLEQKHPEAAGAMLADLAADPFAKARELAKNAGLPEKLVEAFVRRAQRQYLKPKEEMRRVTQMDLQTQVDDRLSRLLDQIDDLAILEAPLRDKAYAFDRVFNARQLMRGEPTQILSVDDRRTINQLMPALMLEAQRRGITIDAIPTNTYSDSGGPALSESAVD